MSQFDSFGGVIEVPKTDSFGGIPDPADSVPSSTDTPSTYRPPDLAALGIRGDRSAPFGVAGAARPVAGPDPEAGTKLRSFMGELGAAGVRSIIDAPAQAAKMVGSLVIGPEAAGQMASELPGQQTVRDLAPTDPDSVANTLGSLPAMIAEGAPGMAVQGFNTQTDRTGGNIAAGLAGGALGYVQGSIPGNVFGKSTAPLAGKLIGSAVTQAGANVGGAYANEAVARAAGAAPQSVNAGREALTGALFGVGSTALHALGTSHGVPSDATAGAAETKPSAPVSPAGETPAPTAEDIRGMVPDRVPAASEPAKYQKISKTDILDSVPYEQEDRFALQNALDKVDGDFVRVQLSPSDFKDIPRENIDPEKVKAFAEQAKTGSTPPPIIAIPDKAGDLQLKEGRHRLLAAALNERAAGGDASAAKIDAVVPESWVAARDSKSAEPVTGRNEPMTAVRQNADQYMKQRGVAYNPVEDYAPIDTARSKKIAAEYDAATHSPNDPKVKASYDVFKSETKDQWDFLKSKGVKFESWTGEGQPYKNSADMVKDVKDNGHLFFFQGKNMPADHPLAEALPGEPGLTYNDAFRAVHDYFGHAKEGYQFGPRGEENAWRAHSSMYSPEARGAMTAETRGQNSWVNFGPHGEFNRANPAKTKFAEQKATLLSPEFSNHEPADYTSSEVKGTEVPPSDHDIEQAKNSSELGAVPSAAGAKFMGGPLAAAKTGWAKLGAKIGTGKDLLGSIAGEAYPTMARLNRETAEAGVHVRSAREYSLARSNEAHEAMIRAVKDAGDIKNRGQAIETVDKAWAVLTEDNLRGLKQEKIAAGDHEGASKVGSMIGSDVDGLHTEAEYQSALKNKNVQAAIEAYTKFRPELEEKFQQGTGNKPNGPSASRGLQTGVRINLLAKLDSAGNPVNEPVKPGTSSAGRPSNPLSRKPRVSRGATGTAQGYETTAKEGLLNSYSALIEPAAKREFAAAAEKSGLAEIRRGYGDPVEGRRPVEIEKAKPAIDKNGKAVVDKKGKPVMVQPKVAYFDPRIDSEVRRVYNLDKGGKIPVLTALLNSHTGASLLGLGEAVYHTGTLVGGMQRAFNLKGGPAANLLNSGFIRLGRSLAAVGKEAIDAARKTPESLAAKSERARIGATRPEGQSNTITSKYIHVLHEAVGAAIQKMAHEAADLGVIPNTETAIRDSITKNLGQYNKGLKGRLTDALQESGAAPFLGTQKAQLGLLGRFFTGSTGVKGADAKLRANHFINLIGTAVQIGAASYLMSGHFFGRKGVPLGDIDTGKDDKNGNPITIPTSFMLGLTPFKRSGMQKLTTGLKDGRDKGLISQDVFNEIVRNVTRLAGPGVKTGFTLATGKALDPALFDTTPAAPPGSVPWQERLKTAAAQINPGVTKAAAIGVEKMGGKDFAENMRRYAGHPEDSIVQSQLKALLPSGAAAPNDAAIIAAQEKEYKSKLRRESRNRNAQ